MNPVLVLRDVIKDYRGLRPLRVRELVIEPGEFAAISGPDATEASVLVDIITGTSLPDAGEVTVNGTGTASLADQDAWLKFLEQFGLVNPRVVLLESLSVLQNLAIPLTLSVDPMSAETRARARALASAVGLPAAVLDLPVGSVNAAEVLRVRLGRALALDPAILLLEHPTHALESADATQVARDLARLVSPGRTVVAVTADEAVARVASRALVWRASTGELRERRAWRPWRSG